MLKHRITRGEAKALRMLAKAGMAQARSEPDAKLAAKQRKYWTKALEKSWPPFGVVKQRESGYLASST